MIMSVYPEEFDVLVVGGGHAGTEAAAAAARMGARTLMLTQNLGTIGEMSCNPSLGGIAKGTLVKEVDALDGVMARAADRAGIQLRRLNQSKGPAVQATRFQIDRDLYRTAVKAILAELPQLKMFQQSVHDLWFEQGKLVGVQTAMGLRFRARTVVITTGTFLGGVIHMGRKNYGGGRAGEAPSTALAQTLERLQLPVARLKTGTPPRLDGRSLDFSQMEEQPGDPKTPCFSYLHQDGGGFPLVRPEQRSCFVTYTNATTHDIIREGLADSPIYNGVFRGPGPRYCPSIEDKVVRFDQPRHQIFAEPEGLGSMEWYPNGISTSLSFDTQVALVRSIPGFERADITRPGYAIEYAYVDPRALRTSLETRDIQGLFLAGQINGTTGYEEAAAQGLLAGLNAARAAQGLSAWVPARHEAYLGVLVDDLVTLGTSEPYRMFTSRAEYRLLLREDNADQRLTPIGRELGCVGDQRWASFQAKEAAIKHLEGHLRGITFHPGSAEAARLNAWVDHPLTQAQTAMALLKRPELNVAKVLGALGQDPSVWPQPVLEQANTQSKYAGYIERQQSEVRRQTQAEQQKIPDHFAYEGIPGLSSEVVEKLKRCRPETVGTASRIPGVTPAAIGVLLVYLRRFKEAG